MPDQQHSTHQPLPDWLRDDGDLESATSGSGTDDPTQPGDEQRPGLSSERPAPMRPIPDGGLSDAMPPWLSVEQSQHLEERDQTRERSEPIDPASLISEEDVPDWLKHLAGTPRNGPDAPHRSRAATSTPDPDRTGETGTSPMPPLITSKPRDPAPVEPVAPHSPSGPRPLHEFPPPAASTATRNPEASGPVASLQPPATAASKSEPAPRGEATDTPRAQVESTDDGFGPVVFLGFVILAAFAVVLYMATR